MVSTGASSSGATNSTSPEAPKGRKRGKGDRKERYGQVLLSLRRDQLGDQLAAPWIAMQKAQQYGHGATLHLGKSATNSRLGLDMMQAALSYHLVTLAHEEIRLRSVPRMFTLTEELSMKHFNDKNSKEEAHRAILACHHVIGARRSRHSAIIGTATNSAGLAREPICLQLANQAVDMIESARLLVDGSPQAEFLAQLLPFMLHTIDPTHPFVTSLAMRAIANFFAGPPLKERTQLTDGLLGHDALAAILTDVPLRISDRDLYRCGWTETTVSDSMLLLETLDLTRRPNPQTTSECLLALRCVDVHVLRELAKFMAPSHALNLQTFNSRGLRYMAQVLSNAATGLAQVDPATFTATAGFFRAVLFMFNMCFVCIGMRWVAAWEHDVQARVFLFESQRHFLHALGVFARATNEVDSPVPHIHTQSLLFYTTDVFFEWIPLCVQAVEENQRGAGPLADAGFSLGDLQLIHRGLQDASLEFAKAEMKELQVRKAIIRLTASETAHEMVETALASLEECV